MLNSKNLKWFNCGKIKYFEFKISYAVGLLDGFGDIILHTIDLSVSEYSTPELFFNIPTSAKSTIVIPLLNLLYSSSFLGN